jgi:hypothetical protein
MEGSLVAYKVFSNGSVLNASEINDNLMNQSVIVFSNSAARSAAIPSPIEGMTTYLEDTNNVWVWTGSAWTQLGAPPALTYITTVSGSSVASLSLNNVFSSLYKNYSLLIEATGSTTAALRIRMRSAGADNSSALYFSYFTGINSGGAVSVSETSGTSALISRSVGSPNQFMYRFDVRDPFLASGTRWMGQLYNDANADQAVGGFSHAVSTSFDGFTIFPTAGNLVSVSVQVYGYKD